jgi:hypothetical protein
MHRSNIRRAALTGWVACCHANCPPLRNLFQYFYAIVHVFDPHPRLPASHRKQTLCDVQHHRLTLGAAAYLVNRQDWPDKACTQFASERQRVESTSRSGFISTSMHMHTWAWLPLRLLLLLLLLQLCPGVEGPAASPAGARHTHCIGPEQHRGPGSARPTPTGHGDVSSQGLEVNARPRSYIDQLRLHTVSLPGFARF